MVIQDNEKTWEVGQRYIDVGFVTNNFSYGTYAEPIWVKISDPVDYETISLSIDQAREIQEHLGVLIKTYEDAKPKPPTNEEKVKALTVGTVFHIDGSTEHTSYVRTRDGAMWLTGGFRGEVEGLDNGFFNASTWSIVVDYQPGQ